MMSDYELFIRSEHSTETIANIIAEFLGKQNTMPRVENDPFLIFRTRILGMIISVAEADDFDDDYGIPFSQYNHIVILETPDIQEQNDNINKRMSSLMEGIGFHLSEKRIFLYGNGEDEYYPIYARIKCILRLSLKQNEKY